MACVYLCLLFCDGLLRILLQSFRHMNFIYCFNYFSFCHLILRQNILIEKSKTTKKEFKCEQQLPVSSLLKYLIFAP